MPKSLGFDLYALIVHYVDGDICNCYARKTNEWYYFSDKMDFRIQLGSDNRTITAQQWRRKHFSSSWYISGLLDYVELMTFGEKYLQSELNPMRTDIQNNHTDIVNNYNEYKENKVVTDQTIENHYNEYNYFVNNTYSTFVTETTKNIEDHYAEFLTLKNVVLANNVMNTHNWETIYKWLTGYNFSMKTLVNNFNQLLKDLVTIFSKVWGEENLTYGESLKGIDETNMGPYYPEATNTGEFYNGIDFPVYGVYDDTSVNIEVTDEKQKNLVEWSQSDIGQSYVFNPNGSSGAGRSLENVVKGISDKVDKMYPDYVTFNYLQEYFRGQVSPLWDAIHALQEKLG